MVDEEFQQIWIKECKTDLVKWRNLYSKILQRQNPARADQVKRKNPCEASGSGVLVSAEGEGGGSGQSLVGLAGSLPVKRRGLQFHDCLARDRDLVVWKTDLYQSKVNTASGSGPQRG